MKTIDECADLYPDIYHIPPFECQECPLRDLPEEYQNYCSWGNDYLKGLRKI
jgi:hypothetical protein